MAQNKKQLSFDSEVQPDDQTVVCLGMTFKNDDERRKYFSEKLQNSLQDIKKMEGFPIGNDENIVHISNPPYYTACPNPWTGEIIKEWKKRKDELGLTTEYMREPYIQDVSEGKNDPIYMSHSYHTKVPHKAVMHYILHYTKPGDIVFDGFCGTGMTGVAASYCQDREAVRSIGYEVDSNGNVIGNDGNIRSQIGSRNVVLSDLSPIATHIASQLNRKIDVIKFGDFIDEILNATEKKYEWMFRTIHEVDGKELKDPQGNPIYGIINYVVWSEVFVCNNCSEEIIFWDAAVDKENEKVLENFPCPHCKLQVTKTGMQRAVESKYDTILKDTYTQVKFVPRSINYSVNGKRFDKEPNGNDIQLLKNIEEMNYDGFYPTDPIIDGDEIGRLKNLGINYIFQLMTRRNNIVIGDLLSMIQGSSFRNEAIYVITAAITNLTLLYRWRANKKGGATSGTYYICSTPQENNPFNQIRRKVEDFKKAFINNPGSNAVITTQSSIKFSIEDNSIDYIFTDPPFGSNLMYSELNFLWESWLKLFTNNSQEAVVSFKQNKGVESYNRILTECFNEFFRILKPGRWMTVEFSNSQASVWNAIQEAIQKSGFVIANVSALDKKQGSFKAVTTTTAVKQDLVISAYKPKQESVEKIKKSANTSESAWTFVHQHLEQLPLFLGQKGEAEVIAERTPRILFDRMVAYHVQNGLPVPLSSAEFQAEVVNKFSTRDGMVFLDQQVTEYDKKRILVKEFIQLSMFVTDETSAIEWIRQQLLKRSLTRQDLHPYYMKEIQHISKHEMLPELDELLHQNFLRYDGEGNVPVQIASYLRKNFKDLRGLENDDAQLKEKALHRWYVPDPNKQADLEKLREKTLLREFEAYLEELSNSKKKLKQFRTEAIRAGFKKAWSEKDYQKIVNVAEQLPESVIQEDDKLLMYYDNAQIRLGL